MNSGKQYNYSTLNNYNTAPSKKVINTFMKKPKP